MYFANYAIKSKVKKFYKKFGPNYNHIFRNRVRNILTFEGNSYATVIKSKA